MKYNTLSKEEKKKLKEKYYNTEKGMIQKRRFNRLLIWIILLFIVGIYLVIDATVINYNIWQIVYGAICVITSIIFFVLRIRTIKKTLNSYLVK